VSRSAISIMIDVRWSTLDTRNTRQSISLHGLSTIVSGKGQELWYRNLRYKLVFVYCVYFPVHKTRIWDIVSFSWDNLRHCLIHWDIVSLVETLSHCLRHCLKQWDNVSKLGVGLRQWSFSGPKFLGVTWQAQTLVDRSLSRQRSFPVEVQEGRVL
jgi:hypothetical protein